MALTDLIEDEEVQARFDSVMPRYDRTVRAATLVESKEAPQLVGTAFDYALRWCLEFAAAETHGGEEWIAEESVADLERLRGRGHVDRSGTSYAKAEVDRICSAARSVIAAAKAARKRWAALPQGPERSELAFHAVAVAQLDPIFRSGILRGAVHAPSSQVVKEVNDLLQVLPKQLASARKAYLNPTFGDASTAVGGADADAIIDSILVDFKTVKTPVVERRHVRQLIGYFLLARAHREAGASIPEVTQLALYFSRQGKLWSLSSREFEANPEFTQVERWFRDRYKIRPRRMEHARSRMTTR